MIHLDRHAEKNHPNGRRDENNLLNIKTNLTAPKTNDKSQLINNKWRQMFFKDVNIYQKLDDISLHFWTEFLSYLKYLTDLI